MKKKAAPQRVAYLAQLAQSAPSPQLGKLYGMAMNSVARKTVIRLDKDTKSRFCKKCYAPRSLQTSRWRIEDLSKRQNRAMMVITCECGHITRKPMYTLQSAPSS